MTAAVRASCSVISPSEPGNSAGVFHTYRKRGKNCLDFTRTRPLRDRAQGTGPRAAGYRIHAQLRDLRHRVQQSEKASRPHGGTHPHLRRGTTGRRAGGDDPRPVRGGRDRHRTRLQRKGFRLVRRHAEVYDHCRRRIEIFSKDGGFVFNQEHNILPDVPPENILAMYRAVADSGKG